MFRLSKENSSLPQKNLLKLWFLSRQKKFATFARSA